jgi:hypothetical protein
MGKKQHRTKEKNIFLEIVHLFYGDYLRGLIPRVNVFKTLFDTITTSLEKYDNVGYIAYSFSMFDQMIVSSVQSLLSEGNLYIVTPEPSAINIEDMRILTGSYENLPFKRGYLNNLMVVGLPSKEGLESSIEEWSRVVSEEGRLTVITPSILIQDNEPPLSIGDFVEFHEHQTIEKGEPANPKQFYTILGKYFKNFDEKETAHMTFITAQSYKRAPL